MQCACLAGDRPLTARPATDRLGTSHGLQSSTSISNGLRPPSQQAADLVSGGAAAAAAAAAPSADVLSSVSAAVLCHLCRLAECCMSGLEMSGCGSTHQPLPLLSHVRLHFA